MLVRTFAPEKWYLEDFTSFFGGWPWWPWVVISNIFYVGGGRQRWTKRGGADWGETKTTTQKKSQTAQPTTERNPPRENGIWLQLSDAALKCLLRMDSAGNRVVWRAKKIFSMFTPIWGRFPFWLIFFKWVETTNQWPHWPLFKGPPCCSSDSHLDGARPSTSKGWVEHIDLQAVSRCAGLVLREVVVEKLCFCRLVVVLMIELRYSRYDLFVYNLYILYLQNWVVQRVNVYM